MHFIAIEIIITFLFFFVSQTRLQSANKRSRKKNTIKDEMQRTPGKATLSITSSLQALQRKVEDVYKSRQREKNRIFLDNYGKRSSQSGSYLDSLSFSEQNEPQVLQ